MDRRRFLQVGAAAASTVVGSTLVGCGGGISRSRARAPSGPGAAFEGKIEHLVVLMMENRSYDQMLGALAGPEHDGVTPEMALAYEDRRGRARSIRIRHGAPPDQFSPDPPHNFTAVHKQILGRGRGERADNAGFGRAFVEDHPSVGRRQLEDYATVYAEGSLPILQGLAKEYGVCSHWFCSVPSSTTPNRMFAHAGSSRGVTRQGVYHSRIRGRTIFDALGPDTSKWAVYYHDLPHLWLIGDGWTRAFGRNHHHMGAFARDVREDRLPAYSFIEPQHVIPPWSSQHPFGGVSHGEKLIARVYNTLVSNPGVFEKTLLLIVYDEHGGFYDHVVPPGHPGWNDGYPGVEHTVVAPDGIIDPAAGKEKVPYDFTTLGPRVPAVVVSPWIERGSVFGWKAEDPEKRLTFDHTSILSTVTRMTGAEVGSRRARAAATLEHVVNRSRPRASGDYPARLDYDVAVYHPRRSDARAAAHAIDEEGRVGVASELAEVWRSRHGDATPEEMAARFGELVREG